MGDFNNVILCFSENLQKQLNSPIRRLFCVEKLSFINERNRTANDSRDYSLVE